jgi:hypothetical protein
MRMTNGGRLDFWTLENEIAGRGRRYHRIVIDEAAFTKDGDNKVDGSMMQLWETAIKPTLYDFGGEALVCSNSAGKNSENFSTTSVTTLNMASASTMPPRWTIQSFRSVVRMRPKRPG